MLIEEIIINFNEGFNIFFGEIGVGKFIMIDVIDFVLGGKFFKSLIRIGEDRIYVEVLFIIEGLKIKDVLEEFDIEYDDVLIIIRESY